MHTEPLMHAARLVRITAVAFALAALGVGCSDDDEPDASAPASTSTTAESTAESGGDTTASSSGPQTTGSPEAAALDNDPLGAIAIALEATPGTAIEVELETEAGQVVWEVLVVQTDGQGVEHYISVATGEILKQEPAEVPAIAATPPKITIEGAIATALETVADSDAIEATLGAEGALAVWEVEVRPVSGQVIEVHIDATSGKVLRQGPDDD